MNRSTDLETQTLLSGAEDSSEMERGSKKPTCSVVVLGKVGSGKSTVCNMLLTGTAHGPCPVYTGVSGEQTTEFRRRTKQTPDGRQIEVVDSPDVFNMGYTEATATTQFHKWKNFVSGDGPTVFVFTVRLDVRFTPEDEKLYSRYLNLVQEEFNNNVQVAFTFTEGLKGRLQQEVRCSPASYLPGLADGRYISFTRDDTEETISKNLDIITSLSIFPKNRISWRDMFFRSKKYIILLIAFGVLGYCAWSLFV